MNISDLIRLAECALATLPLAALAAGSQPERWLAINVTASLLMRNLRAVAADQDIRADLRLEAGRLDRALSALQLESCERHEALRERV